MQDAFSRTRLLLGEDGVSALARARVAVFGVGGVGSYAAEALVRAGVGHLTLIDDDLVCLTNLNRQIMATHDTVGHFKVDAMRERALSINPEADVVALKMFYGADTAGELDLSAYDYLLDAIDTVSSKIHLAISATRLGVPILSCMGAGNKLDPSRFEVADLFATSVCPLARVMRTELRKRGIARYKVVYSKEPPIAPKGDGARGCREGCVCPPGAVRNCAVRRQVPGSISFVPAAAGLVMAGEAIRTLSGVTDNREGKQ